MAKQSATAVQEYQGGNADGTGAVTPSRIKERWERSQRACAAERQQFWINSAFVANQQWVTWDTLNNVLIETPRTDDRLRRTENRMGSGVRTLVAKLLKRPLVFEVPPTSADDGSTSGSRTAVAVATDVHHRHDWETDRHTAAMLCLKGGVTVLCTEWDPKAGTPIGTLSTGGHFGTGDTVESVLGVTEVGCEPGLRDFERGLWWIKATALPPPTVKEMFGLDADPPADASAGLSPLQRSLLAGDNGAASETKLTLVLKYFERPNDDNQSGTVATVVNGAFVDGGPKSWPFPFKDRLNAVVVTETPHDHDWLGDTIVSNAVSPQASLNHAVSKIDEHMKLAGDARLGVPEGAGDEWDDLSDVPEVVRYFGQQLPAWVAPPVMPEWWITAPERAKAAVDDALGVHDISRGETPGNVDSGVALSLLADQDDTPLGLLAKEMALAYGRLMTLVLQTYEVKVTEDRHATVERPGQAPERVTWSGKDLHGQTTAVVPLDAVAPRSEAAVRAFAFQLKTTFPEMDLRTFAKLANLPDAGDLIEATDPQVAKAQRENGEMFAGNIAFVADFDDHATHIHEHNVARLSARYEALDDNGRAIFDAHVKGHEVDGAREMGQQMAKSQVSPALAAAPQANEPPMAGAPDAAAQMGAAHASGFAAGGMTAAPGGGAGVTGPTPSLDAGGAAPTAPGQ